MLGQSTLGIGVTMFLRDQFSGPSANIRQAAALTQADLKKLQMEQLRYQRNMYAGLAFAGAAAVRQIGRSVKRGAEFGYEMEFVKSITSATRQEASDLGSIAKQLGQDTMFFSQDVAEGMRFMGMAGMEARQIKTNIGAAVRLAGATKSQIGGKGGAADIMTNIMKAFNIESKYSGKVADILSYATTRANTNLFDLGEALKYSASTAMDMNVSLQESTAMVMALGNAGMQGSMAGVAMENSMRYLARATGAFGSGTQKKALDIIGLSKDDITDSSGNLLSMVDVIKKVAYTIDSTFGAGNNIEKQGILQTVFGVRGKRAGSLLIRNFKEFDKFVSDVSTKSGGHSTRVMKDMMDTVQGYILRVKSSAQNLSIIFADTLEPTIKSILFVVEKAIGGIQWLLKSPLGNFIGPAIAGWITLKTVMWGTKAVISGITLLKMQMGGVMNLLRNNTVTSWNSMTIAATRYSAATRAANIASINSMKASGISSVLGVNKAGALYRTRTGLTGRAGQLVGAAAAGRYARMFGGKVASKAAMGVGARAIGPVIGRIAGVLTGPVGMALSFILPGLIGMAIRAIKGNKEATERSTEVHRKNLEVLQRGRIGAIEMLDYNAPRLMTAYQYQRVMSPRDIKPEGFRTMMSKYGQSERAIAEAEGIPVNINIYLDGEEISTRTIEKVESAFRSNYHNAGFK